MKKLNLLLISLGLFLLLVPLKPATANDDVCNPSYGIKIQTTSTSVYKIYTITSTLPSRSLKAILECDNQKIDENQKICKEDKCQVQLSIDKSSLKGSCVLKIARKYYAPNLHLSQKKCSYPIQSVYIKNSEVPASFKDKNGTKEVGVWITTTKPIKDPSKYKVKSDCYEDWFRDDIILTYTQKSINEPNTYFFSTTDFNPDSKKNNCSYILLDPNGNKVTTQKEAIEDAENLKISPNDPCSLLRGDDRVACHRCMGDSKNPKGNVWTVFGCIKLSSSGEIFKFFFNFLSYMAGGIATLLFIYAAFLYMTSGGDAEKLKKAKGLMTAIVSGILFIIFSIMIMRFIGLTLFDIPTLKTG